jgi:AcrR family transcriptional regulator
MRSSSDSSSHRDCLQDDRLSILRNSRYDISTMSPQAGRTTGPGERRGRPVGDRDAKRTALLDAAMAVIAEDGFATASLRKVAARADCTTGAVTYYFANKDEMLTAVAQSFFDEVDTILSTTDDDRVDVRAMLERWLDRTRSRDSRTWLVMFQLLAHARHEPALVAVVRERYARFRQTLASILEKGQRQGAIRNDISADLLADQLSAISDGWMMMLPIEPQRFSPKRVRALLDATVKILEPR